MNWLKAFLWTLAVLAVAAFLFTGCVSSHSHYPRGYYGHPRDHYHDHGKWSKKRKHRDHGERWHRRHDGHHHH